KAEFILPQKEEDLEGKKAMEDFVNADQLEVRCRRKVANIYFDNKKIGMFFIGLKVYDDYLAEDDVSGLGESLIIPDDILTRIMGCAHYGKLKQVQDLCKLTGWEDRGGYAAEMFEICCLAHPIILSTRLYSQSPLPSASARLNSTNITPTRTLRSKPKCSGCGILGHTGVFILCYFGLHRVLITL
ncbi:hypothetical protein M422DRAFT_182481, partial [Sphaerobolus stellatus SS14]